MYLLDNNVLSELRKQERADPGVAAWYAGIRAEEAYTSVLVLGEIRKGVENIRGRDPRQAQSLEEWLERVSHSFGERILPVDARVADAWGNMSAGRARPVVDTLLAATAEVHGLTLVTRNTADVEGLDVPTLNPFTMGG